MNLVIFLTYFSAFFIFLLGFNVYGWRKAGVNHVLIFEIDYREHLAPTHLWEVSFVIALTWALSLLAFIHNPLANYLPRYAHPAIFYSFLAILIIFPLPVSPPFSTNLLKFPDPRVELLSQGAVMASRPVLALTNSGVLVSYFRRLLAGGSADLNGRLGSANEANDNKLGDFICLGADPP